ncbi:MAG: HlyD family efflux transporter periplasmic adaptor subunit [Limisphaerales bacterium]|jgi:multidrug resistance efflux pump
MPANPSQPKPTRHIPSRWQSTWVMARADIASVSSSWLARGFLLTSAFLSILMLKGMQAEQKPASQMLEALYSTYIVLWMHAVVFLAGSSLSREQDCLNDAVLSRGITRGEYFSGKILARFIAILGMISLVLLPGSFWAIRQDQLVKTESGFVSSNARDTTVEAWEPKKIFAGTEGRLLDFTLQIGDQIASGDVLAQIDDQPLFDQLETQRRAEETARNEVSNAQRRYEDAQRNVAQAEDALARAERALIGKDLLSKLEQADRETELRSRKRDLSTAQNQLQIARDTITSAELQVENAQARVRDARLRLGRATITAPISGYITELHVQSAQYVTLGSHLLTIAPLDEFQVRVPIYEFEEFKRLRQNLPASIKIGETEFTGSIHQIGAMTSPDTYGRRSNYVVVRFKGDGTLGLLGQNADVRLKLPPRESKTTAITQFYQTLTGQGTDDLQSTSASVRIPSMLLGLSRVLGCAAFLTTLTLLLLTTLRSQLIAILGTIGLWHLSNLAFDFAGLPDLSYLELVRTMDKVLSGVSNPTHELTQLAWLSLITLSLASLALTLFISRDPPK